MPALCIKCSNEATLSVWSSLEQIEITLCKNCIKKIKGGN